MPDTVIHVNGVGKKYRLGARTATYRTLRESAVAAAASPLRLGLRAMRGEPLRQIRPEFWALRDVSFEVKRGEVLGIIGRNGAGKSTLLKVLSRITEPTEGEIRLRGRVASLLEVGTGFHPELTGRENVFLNGAILGMARAEIQRKFDEIVAFAEVEQFIDTQVKHFSSGMYLRLAFSVAAHLEPDVLVVDEVLAVGDAAFQKKSLGKMSEVSREGRTVLFVSHNMAAIRTLCSRAILLDRGRIHDHGSTSTVIDAYLQGLEHGEDGDRLPRSDPGAVGEGTRIFCTDQHDRIRLEFKIWEPWRIHLEFDMFYAATDVIAAVGLRTVDGTPLVTYWSRPRDLTPGSYAAVFSFDLPVAHTDLQFAVGLTSRERQFYYVDGVSRVSIADVALGEQPYRTRDTSVLVTDQRPEISERGAE